MKLKELINESVTFFIEPDDNDKPIEFDVNRYEDILSITNLVSYMFEQELQKYPFYKKFVYDQVRERKGELRIDPDGDDWDKQIGTINFYMNGIVNDHFWGDFGKILNSIKQRLETHLTLGELKYEGEHTKNGRMSTSVPKDIRVIRIPVLKNETETSDEHDLEMTLSNANARNFLNVLGISDEDLMGTIHYKDMPRLMMKLRNLKDGTITDNLRPSETKNNFHDFGLDLSRMTGYINNFLELLTYAHSKKKNISFS